MKVDFKDIMGAKIIGMREESVISLVTGVYLDPENGSVIALKCGFRHVLSPYDIIKWSKYVKIDDFSVLVDKKGILRLNDFSPSHMEVMYKAVFTEQGTRIGSVKSYTIDTNSMKLFSITVKKGFLWMTFYETIIPYKDIVEIKEDRIIVRDVYKKVPAGAKPELA